MPKPSLYRFGVFELDLSARALRRAGVRVPLQDLPLRLLGILVAAHPGQVVTREALRDALWEPDVHVDFDTGLNTAVRRVREALNDSATGSRFIETVPRRGYRFLASVDTPVDRANSAPLDTANDTPADGSAATVDDRQASATSRSRRRIEPWIVVAFLAIGVAGWWLGRQGATTANPVEATAPHNTSTATRSDIQIDLERARHFGDTRTQEGLERAIAAYQRVQAIDPNATDAYSGLAASYVMLGVYDYRRPSEVFPTARTLTARALALDSASAQTQVAAGLLAFFADWQWQQAEAHLERAATLDPNSADVHLMRGALLTILGRTTEGLTAARHALTLEPTSAVVNTQLAWQYFLADQSVEALAQSQQTLALAPNYYDAWDNLKWMHIVWGNEADAMAAWRRAERLQEGSDEGLAALLDRHGLRGTLREVANERLHQATAGDERYRSPYDLVIELATLGEVETALDWLDRSFAERETDLVALGVDPRLDPLRAHPRFAAMLERLTFPAHP